MGCKKRRLILNVLFFRKMGNAGRGNEIRGKGNAKRHCPAVAGFMSRKDFRVIFRIT